MLLLLSLLLLYSPNLLFLADGHEDGDNDEQASGSRIHPHAGHRPALVLTTEMLGCVGMDGMFAHNPLC